MTARQYRFVDPGWLSINSNSSSQSAAESWACSLPNNSFTALMNAENSRSAICVCSLQIELENDSFVFIAILVCFSYAGHQEWGFHPHCTEFLIDSDGVHKCDHTRSVEKKQLDDGIGETLLASARRVAFKCVDDRAAGRALIFR